MDSPLIRGGLPVTSQQRDIVDNVLAHRATVVAAGAGSGKTHTSVATVLELAAQGRASIDEFVLITFTNTAADNLRGRLEQTLGARVREAREAQDTEAEARWRDQQERLAAAYVGTIHGFCRLLLRTHGYAERVARESEMTFARHLRDDALHQALLDHVGRRATLSLFGTDTPLEEYELRRLLDRILQECHNRGYTAEQVQTWTRAQPRDDGHAYRLAVADLVVDVACHYDERKSEHQVLDAYDLLERTRCLLTGNGAEDVLRHVSRRRRYLFIDEFQDTDLIQLEIVKTLADHLDGILVVGDPKQSIFEWRGGHASLLDLAAQAFGTSVLPMNVSRRPTGPYLAAQNTIIRGMGMATLEPYEGIHTPTDDLPELTYVDVDPDDLDARIEATARVIRAYRARSIHLADAEVACPVAPGHIVVLVRKNRMLDAYRRGLEHHLAPHGIAVSADRGESFYQRPEVVSSYRMLLALIHYPDDAVLALALDTPYFRHIDSREEQARLLQYGVQRGHPLTDWLESHSSGVARHLHALRDLLRSATVPQILEELYRRFDIRSHFTDHPDAVLALERLREIARELYGEDQALTLSTFADYLRAMILTGQDAALPVPTDEDHAGYPPHVRIMTVHRAKGLEFPIVVIPEAQEDLIRAWQDPDFLVLHEHGLEVNLPGLGTPSRRYRNAVEEKQQDTLGEELRILYVAVTRAEHAVAFVGSGGLEPARRGGRRYAWKDEVLRLRTPLAGSTDYEALFSALRIP